jgi:undecaprenyl-diphosphatase
MAELDQQLLHALYARGDALAYAMAVVSMIGGGWGLVAIVPWLLVQRTRAFTAWLLGVIATQTTLVFAIKRAVGRVRPWEAMHLEPLLDAPTDYSFPSGHAAGAFACAVFFLASAASAADDVVRRRMLAASGVLLVLASAVAVSRVYLGTHYPSDVLAGVLLGAAIGAGGAKLRARRVAGRRA